MIRQSNCKLTVLVLLHNKTIEESKTISSMLSFKKKLNDEIELIIWNNGCSKGSEVYLDDDTYDVKTINSYDNVNISQVYNKVIYDYFSSQRIVIFDDDSLVDISYISSLISFGEEPVICPDILFNGEKVYPISIDSNTVIDSNVKRSIKSINSGLSLSRTLIDKIRDENGDVFDSRFSFYGVDFSFFYRLDRLSIDVLQVGSLEHSLSRFEVTYSKNDFRWRQKLYENILMVRNYPEYNSKVLIIKVLCKVLISFSLNTISSSVRVFLNNMSTIK